MKKKITHYSGIGGQAVLEGVMMRNKDLYAVAVRKPDGQVQMSIMVFYQDRLFLGFRLYEEFLFL